MVLIYLFFGIDRLLHGINQLINNIIPLIHGWATGRGTGAAAKGRGALAGGEAMGDCESQFAHALFFGAPRTNVDHSRLAAWRGRVGCRLQKQSVVGGSENNVPQVSADETVHAKLRTHRTFN